MCDACHLTKSYYWEQGHVTCHRLQSSIRHASDPGFVSFLALLRQRPPTENEIMRYLGDCFLREGELDQYLNRHHLHICTHLKDVHDINEAILVNEFDEEQIVHVGVHVRWKSPPTEDMLKWADDPDFHQLRKVAVGARVRFTSNVHMAKGAPNGAIGTVEHIELDDDGLVKAILVCLEGSDTRIRVTRSTTQRRTSADTAEWDAKRCTFPLLLVYAMTAHASQGATIRTSVVLHVRSAFAKGMLYVMLSRVTDRTLLKLATPLTPDDFNCAPGVPPIVDPCPG